MAAMSQRHQQPITRPKRSDLPTRAALTGQSARGHFSSPISSHSGSPGPPVSVQGDSQTSFQQSILEPRQQQGRQQDQQLQPVNNARQSPLVTANDKAGTGAQNLSESAKSPVDNVSLGSPPCPPGWSRDIIEDRGADYGAALNGEQTALDSSRRCSGSENKGHRHVVYRSAFGHEIHNIKQLRDFLLSDVTCKCGLPCPLIIDKWFDFNPASSFNADAANFRQESSSGNLSSGLIQKLNSSEKTSRQSTETAQQRCTEYRNLATSQPSSICLSGCSDDAVVSSSSSSTCTNSTSKTQLKGSDKRLQLDRRKKIARTRSAVIRNVVGCASNGKVLDKKVEPTLKKRRTACNSSQFVSQILLASKQNGNCKINSPQSLTCIKSNNVKSNRQIRVFETKSACRQADSVLKTDDSASVKKEPVEGPSAPSSRKEHCIEGCDIQSNSSAAPSVSENDVNVTIPPAVGVLEASGATDRDSPLKMTLCSLKTDSDPRLNTLCVQHCSSAIAATAPDNCGNFGHVLEDGVKCSDHQPQPHPQRVAPILVATAESQQVFQQPLQVYCPPPSCSSQTGAPSGTAGILLSPQQQQQNAGPTAVVLQNAPLASHGAPALAGIGTLAQTVNVVNMAAAGGLTAINNAVTAASNMRGFAAAAAAAAAAAQLNSAAAAAAAAVNLNSLNAASISSAQVLLSAGAPQLLTYSSVLNPLPLPPSCQPAPIVLGVSGPIQPLGIMGMPHVSAAVVPSITPIAPLQTHAASAASAAALQQLHTGSSLLASAAPQGSPTVATVSAAQTQATTGRTLVMPGPFCGPVAAALTAPVSTLAIKAAPPQINTSLPGQAQLQAAACPVQHAHHHTQQPQALQHVTASGVHTGAPGGPTNSTGTNGGLQVFNVTLADGGSGVILHTGQTSAPIPAAAPAGTLVAGAAVASTMSTNGCNVLAGAE